MLLPGHKQNQGGVQKWEEETLRTWSKPCSATARMRSFAYDHHNCSEVHARARNQHVQRYREHRQSNDFRSARRRCRTERGAMSSSPTR